MGTRLGMQWFSTGIGFLIGSPIAGVLLAEAPMMDAKRGFLYLQVFGGAIMAGGGLFLLVPLMAIFRHDRQQAATS